MEICLGLRNKDKSISLKKLILLLKKQKFADLLSFIFQMSQRDFLSTNTKGTLHLIKAMKHPKGFLRNRIIGCLSSLAFFSNFMAICQ